MNFDIRSQRKSFIEPGEIFFWTATVNKWQHLLEEDQFKDIIISSLKYLSGKRTVDVFAFVIMPNHVHLICRINEMNGKESPVGSFLKYTAHEFKKLLRVVAIRKLSDFSVDAKNKNYEFWKRDSLALQLYSKQVAFQKLDYIHANPLTGKWQLVMDPCDYKYSSAAFYERGDSIFLTNEDMNQGPDGQFGFLKDLRKEF